MDMSLVQCWDCPVPILRALLQALVSLGLLGVMVRLASTRPIILRVIGVIGTGLALFLYVIVGVGLIKWGVTWHEAAYSSRAAQFLVVGPWLAATVFLVFKLQRSYRRRQSSLVDAV